ncbi:unnamed protein product [Clonostachys byssicola]|uniref:Uncharacterized protein n=1 Tax=Clonostachys byssicola TaxID=160290 RepID=A0A9N9UVH8_9HYPO|nr:unnamed protein product [Clonostachys byssicola]
MVEVGILDNDVIRAVSIVDLVVASSELMVRTYIGRVLHIKTCDASTVQPIRHQQQGTLKCLIGGKPIVPCLAIAIERPDAGAVNVDVLAPNDPPGGRSLELELERPRKPVIDIVTELDGPRYGDIHVLQETEVQR